MTQTFDLKSMGFAEMQNDELEMVDGGFWAQLLAVAVAVSPMGPCIAVVGAFLAVTAYTAK